MKYQALNIAYNDDVIENYATYSTKRIINAILVLKDRII
jgi:hypothetical protein